jgi:hypothetical protein
MATPDYHPLSIEEIAVLLHEAALAHDNGNGFLVNRIQIRLTQGIRGMEDDPRPAVDTPVAQKSAIIDRAFMNFVERGDGNNPELTQSMARTLHAIMES